MIKPMTTKSRAAKLELVADAVMRKALATPAGVTQDLLIDGAETIQRSAGRMVRKAKAGQPPVLILPANATPTEMRAARRRRAVQRGTDVYLPAWEAAVVGLPNALLRSAIWSMSNADGELLINKEIATIGDAAIIYTGERLDHYDRRVFAACLAYYRDDRPLSPGGTASWIRLSFHQFLQDADTAYSADSHKALRDSLLRLQAATIQVRANGLDMPVPRLVEVTFADGYARQDLASLRGGDKITFRVLEQLAQLYGPDDWTKVSRPSLKYNGLQSWLAGFYQTHSQPHWSPIKSLYSISGATGKLAEFRRGLKSALARLQAPEVPAEIRIDEVHTSKCKKYILIIGADWRSRKIPPVPNY